MTVQIDISQLEDQVLNPLNNIMLLSYGNDVYKNVEAEVRRIIFVLEREHLINKRLKNEERRLVVKEQRIRL